MLRLEPNGHTGAQVTAVGCLAALNHCRGQDIPAIDPKHQPSAAQALFAGFRTRICLVRASAYFGT